MSATDRLHDIVKSYDVRGRSPEVLDPALVYALGAALGNRPEAAAGVVVGRDMRQTSPSLAAALVDGVTAAGTDVVDIGLASTDMLYYAAGTWDLAGVMVTASHNPAAYNGLKMCRPGARPIGRETGLLEIRDAAARIADGADQVGGRPTGTVVPRDALEPYARRMVELVDIGSSAGRPPRVVVDAANAMAGHIVPAVLGHLDVDLVPLHFELDGSFPNHEANPLDPANLTDLQAAVRRYDADLGLAFDGDADRCFFVDHRGRPVSPSAVTALVASRYLEVEPGATILYNLISSRAVPEIVAERGGVPVRTPVGHSTIKAEMARTGAVFGGEHSGHYYFRDFFLADSGMLAALHVLAAMSERDAPIAALVADLTPYSASGEINREVADVAAVTDRVEARYTGRSEVEVDRLDGLTLSHADWWFNLRASQTEPLLRLNVEGADEPTMRTVRDDVLALIDEESR